jgi:hypothetical protein
VCFYLRQQELFPKFILFSKTLLGPTDKVLFKHFSECAITSDNKDFSQKLYCLVNSPLGPTDKVLFKALCGGSVISMNSSCMFYNYGVSLPQNEHVDIFPVRLVSTFHRVFSVYLTLAVYITYSSLSLRAE